MSSNVLLWVDSGVSLLACGFVIYSCVAHVMNLLYCHATAGFLLVILSTWLFLGYIVLSWVWQCNDLMINVIPIFIINPIYRKDGLTLLIKVSSLRYWLVFSLTSYGNRGRSVPGSDTQQSVAPSKGEQPWMSAPRCSSPCPKWSMMIFFATSGTYFLFSRGLNLCLFNWVYENWILINFSYLTSVQCLIIILLLLGSYILAL